MPKTRYVAPFRLCSSYSWADQWARHYSYECTVTAQERPYMARPSRTQQLQNPKLMPKLSNETPNDLQRTNGVADELLAKREEERGRKRSLDGDGTAEPYSKRTRSVSSHSASSVSTISTTRSRSASPPRQGRDANGSARRIGSVSPAPSKSRKRRYSDASNGYSDSSYSSGARHRSRSREWAEDRNIRRRRRESSPEQRGRHRESERHGSRRRRARSQSADKSRIAKERQSMTPNTTRDQHGRRSYRDRANPPAPGGPKQDPRGRPGQPPRERSMSPYSKRLALTQTMNLGR